jgi:magnesium-transporting ATPase (P-type)
VTGVAAHERYLSVKGAPEVILGCRGGPTTHLFPGRAMRAELAARVAGKASPVLAVAERASPRKIASTRRGSSGCRSRGSSPQRSCKSLCLRRPRSDARCHVETMMITGDHLSTAEAVASELGLMTANG